MTIKRAILIGFGHHGRNRLFKSLLNLESVEDILLYDVNGKAFELLEKTAGRKRIETTDSRDTLYGRIGPEAFVVIGTTARDHLDLFRSAVQRGARYIYLEKPVAQSMADCCEIAELAKKHGVKVAVGFYNDFLPLAGQVEALQRECRLGSLIKVSSEGGAVCLSTNGVHVIDLAGILFGAPPTEVYGKITSRTQNPRGAEYGTFGGVVHALYEGGRELLLGYHNGSILSNDIILYYEYGLIRASYSDAVITVHGFTRDLSGQPKYRYESPSVVKTIPNQFDFNRLFDVIFGNLLAGGPYCGIDRALNNMQVLLGAMISNATGATLSLPLAKEHANFHDRFPIT